MDIAAKVLINEQDFDVDAKNNAAQSRYKTKVRRLYDVANVLSAIGLIEKVDLYNCIIRKPIFKYTGPNIGNIPLVNGKNLIALIVKFLKNYFKN